MFLYQPQNGYCYNSDTHFLYSFITICLKKFKNIQGELLDIGSGSGILGLLVIRDYKKLNLNQVEIQENFQFLSQKNSEINSISNTLFKGSLFKIEFNKQFDYIVSNPPFYHSNVIKSENQNIKIARYNENMPLENFIKKVSQILKPRGKFFFCYDVKQLDDIISLLKEHKLNIEVMQFLHPKQTKDATLVMIYARKNSKSLLNVISPLIMFDDASNFTTNVQNIYEKCATHSIKVDI